MILTEFANKFERLKKVNGGFTARCPAHEDNHNSLSINRGNDNRILLHCHAGCDNKDIVAVVGCTMADLMPEVNGHSHNGSVKKKIVKEYDYCDEQGTLLYKSLRFEPKDFRQQLADGSWTLGNVRRVPYRLPELIASDADKFVFIPEGEKDVDELIHRGLVATTNAGGGGKWRPEYNEPLRGRHVVVLPDNDPTGEKHAEQVTASLQGIAASVRVLRLPGLPPKGDVSDWLDAGWDAGRLAAMAEAEPEATGGAVEAETVEVAHEKPEPIGNLSILKAKNRTETSNAKRLIAKHGDRLRRVEPWKRWLVWDGKRWRVDDTLQAEALAIKIASDLWGEAVELAQQSENKDVIKSLMAFCKSSNRDASIKSTLSLARSQPGVQIESSMLDVNPWLLNVENGTVDLKTGKLKPHCKDDYLTKMAGVVYNAGADCPVWYKFLDRIFAGNKELIRFVRQLAGIILTGSTAEHIFPFLHGIGANGKSTLIGALLYLMGDYAMEAPEELLLVKKGSHPTELADLHGKRFVAAIEADGGRRLAEALIKSLTGGDRIRARRMREDFWEFQPTHKIWLAANHKLTIRGNDHGFWRRIKMIPFNVVIPKSEQDIHLNEKLKDEMSGILNWALIGLTEWRAEGLIEPNEVTNATSGYRQEMDVIGVFLDERCILDENNRAGSAELYKVYAGWCESSGEHPCNQRRFAEQLSERGFESIRGGQGKRYRMGIGLLDANR